MSILINASQRNTYDDDHRQYAYGREGGQRINQDQVITTSRGEPWIFQGVGRYAYGNSSGRVSVSRVCPDASMVNGLQQCPHMWHENGIEHREFFPSVFELYLGLADGTEA